MQRGDYLRMLDSGMDSETIAKIMAEKQAAPSEAFDWKAQERLETDFVTRPAMPIRVESDIYDRPSTQRLYGAPVYDQSGELHCRSCGQVVNRTISRSGEGIAMCSNIGCNANGFAYAEGSFLRNPHRVTP
jgi:hypothetical protein